MIIESGGARIPVEPNVSGGFVEGRDVDGLALLVRGWAATSAGAGDRIVVFVKGRFVKTVKPDLPRPDLVERFGKKALLSGFNAGTQLTESASSDDVQVFAIDGGTATELSGPGG